MNDTDFKNTLIGTLRCKNIQMGKKEQIVSILLKSSIYIEYTSIFTRTEWDTYCAILHIQVPVETYDLMENSKKELLPVAEKVFGKQGDHYLTDIEIGIIVVHHETIDLSGISVTSVVFKAIEDAELFMREGKYDSAFDRVHTAFHGYLRWKLDNLGEKYEESDTLHQLYNKLHTYVKERVSTDQSDLIKTAIRSASGVVSSINDWRNRYSLAHPNNSIISTREAELCIRLVKDLTDYIEKVV